MTDTELRTLEAVAAAPDTSPRAAAAIRTLSGAYRALRERRVKVPEEDKAAIRTRYALALAADDKSVSTYTLAEEFGISQTAVYFAIHGRTPRGKRRQRRAAATDNM